MTVAYSKVVQRAIVKKRKAADTDTSRTEGDVNHLKSRFWTIKLTLITCITKRERERESRTVSWQLALAEAAMFSFFRNFLYSLGLEGLNAYCIS